MGARTPAPRSGLAGWESGQDHVGLYLYNGNEYLEATLGANRARAVPFNVNYRYVEHELGYLLRDSSAAFLVYHAAFAPVLAATLPALTRPPALIQVADDSGNELLPGAVDYEQLLASASPGPPPTEPDPEDLYILYTGGTTGMPKGTLWRQADIYTTALGGVALATGVDTSTLDAARASLPGAAPVRCLPTPPLMHGSAGWVAMGTLLAGGTVVIQSEVTRLDPADVLSTVARESVQTLVMVGDAFARPLCAEAERGGYDLSSLTGIVTGGATLSPAMKERLLALVPQALVIDIGGASETGSQLTSMSLHGQTAELGVFTPGETTCVVDELREYVLAPGHDGIGWLARRGPIPLGYLGDEQKTAATFPVIAGERMSIPGDRARLRADGSVELLGRESMTINSGGEKIFAEEVEQALVRHPAIDDVLVVGRPSAHWGSEVVAVVQLGENAAVSDDELLATAAERIARYKLPKAIMRVPAVQRSPSGKADYGWAKRLVTAPVAETDQ
jgi:3-oxocholest-4-en-26-oate---CoA ligase